MNYLGHAFLSSGDSEILTGNMIADHVKGQKALENYPVGIRKGIELHRKIDGKTDLHPATRRGKLFFNEEYGLYSGPILDTLYDHFLANDPKFFPTEDSLKGFAQDVYKQLETNKEWFPEKFAAYFPSMREHDWLYGYRSLAGMKKALGGLARRALHMQSAEKAYEIFIVNYYTLNQCYYELIDDIINFVKIESGF